MAIPAEFKLLNRTWNVIPMDDATFRGSDAHGLCTAQQAEIQVYMESEPEDFVQHTYFHELVHALLETAGRDDLSKDEAFVDLLGGLLHQYSASKEGDVNE